MNFKTDHPCNGNVQESMDFLASFLVSAGCRIESRGETSLVAVRATKVEPESPEEIRETRAVHANPLRGLNRIEVRHEAGALRAIAESDNLTVLRRVAIGFSVLGPLVIAGLIYLNPTGGVEGLARTSNIDNKAIWVVTGGVALFTIAICMGYLSLRNRTQRSLGAMLQSSAAVAIEHRTVTENHRGEGEAHEL